MSYFFVRLASKPSNRQLLCKFIFKMKTQIKKISRSKQGYK